MMNTIGFLELNSIAKGVEACDAALKSAAIRLVSAHPACPGKYEMIFTGELSDVQAAMDHVKGGFERYIVDSSMMGRIDEQVVKALFGAQETQPQGSLAVVETFSAASAINQQPWFFVAVTDKNLMAELSGSGSKSGDGSRPAAPQGGTAPGASQGGDMPNPPQGGTAPGASQGGDMPNPPQGGTPAAKGGGGAKASLGDSPLAIIVYMNESTSSPNPSFDCGLAVQNMYIAAASLGYGAKIISSPTRSLNGADHDAICQKLGVDPSLTAVAVLLIGKPAGDVDGVSGASTRADLGEKAIIIG